ncbi:hypothetical protein PENTCL1PPCAC_5394 [Pristionchus entomophagus]|uniref:Uncharacterized protein n=1 Tax=Pristionchus entomophagus TaxID=358040 RepID=A0AAV5SPH4_9BILA|nr:hypothetical protein PENTCL1PPCAC_5394 [Pristionchus entomophagus]
MVSELVANQNQLSRLNSAAPTRCERLRTLRVEENCLGKEQFDRHILENSSISLITHAGNFFQDKDFQDLPGYSAYQERYTATRKKM